MNIHYLYEYTKRCHVLESCKNTTPYHRQLNPGSQNAQKYFVHPGAKRHERYQKHDFCSLHLAREKPRERIHNKTSRFPAAFSKLADFWNIYTNTLKLPQYEVQLREILETSSSIDPKPLARLAGNPTFPAVTQTQL